MPLPPSDPNPPPRPAQRPAQVLLNSPLAASSRMLSYRAPERRRPPMLWRRVIALAGSLLVQMFFLFAFVLGPAWEPPPGPPAPALQAQFIELPELSPPPPPRGETPRKLGPAHQGHAAQVAPSTRAAASVAARSEPQPPTATPAVTTQAKVSAAPPPSPSMPQPEALPKVAPVPVAVQPPAVHLPTPSLQPPVPPKFQPKPLRPPQLEGTEAMPPPPSLATPVEPMQSPPSIAPPSVALDHVVPNKAIEAVMQPVQVAPAAAPPQPELQAIPLAVPRGLAVSVQTNVHVPAPLAPQQLTKAQAPTVAPAAEQPLAAIPQAAHAPGIAPVQAAPIQVETAPALPGKETIAPVALSAQAGETNTSANAATATAASGVQAAKSAGQSGASASANDVSSAPNASAQGSDNARPGEPHGVDNASAADVAHGNGPEHSHGLGAGKGAASGKGPGSLIGHALSGENAPAKPGLVPDFVQLKPTGDTRVMHHKINGISYKATRWDPYWTPEGESSVDTALRRAAEKTTIKHTFHLPRGIRIKCSVMPLVPVALFGCSNADPPPAPLPAKMYDRLNLPPPPGNGVPPSPATAASTAKPAPIRLSNDVECAEARVAGGPMPPNCPATEPVIKRYMPAASSSSWVPASDQFH